MIGTHRSKFSVHTVARVIAGTDHRRSRCRSGQGLKLVLSFSGTISARVPSIIPAAPAVPFPTSYSVICEVSKSFLGEDGAGRRRPGRGGEARGRSLPTLDPEVPVCLTSFVGDPPRCPTSEDNAARCRAGASCP